MLKLPICDTCTHYLEDEEKDRCKAFPDGIPFQALHDAKEDCKCKDGYGYEEKKVDTTSQ